MNGVISIPYIPIKEALYSDKVDKLGYIYGDAKRGDGLTYEEYNKRLKEEHLKSNAMFNGNYLHKKYKVSEQQHVKYDETKYEYYDITCPILNGRRAEMQPFELVKCRADGSMFIMLVDIPIKSIDQDVESEIRFWVKDSMSINTHHEIPENERLKMLPTKDLKIKVGDISGILCKCRVVDFWSPFRIMILVERFLK